MKFIKKYLRVIFVIVLVMIVLGVYKVIPRYYNPYAKSNISEKIGLIVGNKDRSEDLLNDIVLEDNRILFSYKNMNRFIDANIYIDKQYNQIITNSVYSTKVIDYTNKKMREYLSDSWEDIYIKEINGEMYFDIAELQDVYGIDVKYIGETNLVFITKDIHEYKVGTTINKVKLMYLPSNISAKIDEIDMDSKVYILKTDKNYYNVIDELGRFGYIKQNDVDEVKNVKEYIGKKYDKNINLVWDYMYYTSPDRASEAKIQGVNIISPTWLELVDDNGNILDKTNQSYINWTKQVDYDIWVMFSNNSKIDTTSKILNDSKLREKVIKQVLDICVKNDFDGINVDFENMYKDDKDMYSEFIRELSVAFRKNNIYVSADVTVPDGSDTWSLCFDRKAIADSVDYLIIMAYDQTNGSSQKPNSVAASNWVEANINKFLTNEGVSKEKLVLGIPFYTRLWQTNTSSNKVNSSVVNMKDVNNIINKYSIKTNWLEDEKQSYGEMVVGNNKYQIWVEDLKSIEEKLKIFKKYELAGIASWEKDREDANVWGLINSYIAK